MANEDPYRGLRIGERFSTFTGQAFAITSLYGAGSSHFLTTDDDQLWNVDAFMYALSFGFLRR